MSDMRINGLAFDRGIDGISYASRDAGSQHLPERQELAPPADGVRAQLAQLLALQSALDGLGAAAEQTSNQEDSRVLNRALRLLKDEAGLRDLVTMYRSALYQG